MGWPTATRTEWVAAGDCVPGDGHGHGLRRGTRCATKRKRGRWKHRGGRGFGGVPCPPLSSSGRGSKPYALGGAYMVTREQVRQSITRLVGVWPTLARRDALRSEIGHAIMRHAERIDPVDIRRGLDDLIASARAQQNDGGPAAPPGPHEVVGCILSAARVRDMDDTNTPAVGVMPEVVAADARLRDDLARGERVTIEDVRRSNMPRRYVPGLSFSEWWASLPEGERAKHEALRRMMDAREGLAAVDG